MKKNFTDLLKDTQNSVKSLKKQWREKISKMKEVNHMHEKKEELLKHLPHFKTERTVVDISGSSVARATVIIILLFVASQFLYEIRDILLLFFVALLFSAALDPTVSALEKRHVHRGISILLIYLVLFIIIAVFISNFIPLVAKQLIELANRIGEIINNLTSNGKSDIPFTNKLRPLINQFLESADRETIISSAKEALLAVGVKLQGLAGNAWNAVKIIFNGILNFIFVLVITFFMTLDERGIDRFIQSLFPAKHKEYITEKSRIVKFKIGSWLRGQVILSLTIGVCVSIGLSILRVDYAATLGMIAAMTEFIPYVGPIMAAIPAILIAVNQSPFLAIWVIGMYIVIQQLENNLIVPIIMKHAVGLSPIIIIFAMLVAAKFLGVLGIVLAIPVSTIIWIFVKDYTGKEK